MLKLPSAAIAQSVARFLRNESGATSIEYAMIASGVSIAILVSVTNLGSTVKGLFVSVSNSLK